MPTCPICLSESRVAENPHTLVHRIECPRCGIFKTQRDVWDDFRHESVLGPPSSRTRANASGWLRENQGILLKQEDRERLDNLTAPSFFERSDRILLYLKKRSDYFGHNVPVGLDELLGVTWGLNREEVWQIVGFLEGEELIDLKNKSLKIGGQEQIRLLPKGYKRIEAISKTNMDSVQAFIAMWMDESMDDVWGNGLELGIKKAGYVPRRVDQVEHVGIITDEIIAQIRMSRFIVADFTGHRGGVYFEAGFACGLGLPVIWTCRKSDISELHFDTRQYNFIDWEDEVELAERLEYRIVSIVGKGGIAS